MAPPSLPILPGASKPANRRLCIVIKCAAGLEDVVAHAAVTDCPTLNLTEVESGYLRGSVDRRSLDRMLGLPYATWTGVGLLSITTRQATSAARALRALDPADLHAAISSKRTLSFRFRCLDANRLIAVDDKALRRTAQVIERQHSQFRYNPTKAAVEVWVVRRRGNSHFEGLVRRVARRQSIRGALDDDVAAALVRAFEPAPDDIFLDPFAGHATIPAARARYPAAWIGASDVKPPSKPLVQVEVTDLFSYDLDRYLDGRQPNAVVTDLPWGHHETSLNLRALYDQTLARLTEICAPQMRCALLVARDPRLVDRLCTWFVEPQEPRSVLIHGRKATLLVGTTASRTAAPAHDAL